MSEILRRVRAGIPLDHIPVVDSHSHLDVSNRWYICPRSTTEEVLAYMGRFGVDHWLVFSFAVGSDCVAGNQSVYDSTAAHRDRFSPLVMLHAQFPEDWVPLIDAGKANGAQGIKLISDYQGARELSIDWSPALEQARGQGWAVLNHNWHDPERLRSYADAFPDVAFIIGHFSSGSANYKKVLEECPNVYQSTCAHFACAREFTTEDMVREFPLDKILYGSDALDLDLGTHIGPIAYADIPESAKEAILGRNAMTMFKSIGRDMPASVAAYC